MARMTQNDNSEYVHARKTEHQFVLFKRYRIVVVSVRNIPDRRGRLSSEATGSTDCAATDSLLFLTILSWSSSLHPICGIIPEFDPEGEGKQQPRPLPCREIYSHLEMNDVVGE